jgi:hypothetical protein
MVFAAGEATSSDTVWKFVLAIVGTAVGVALKEVVDRMRARRGVKRLSYDLAIGSTMASIPNELAEKVSVLFEGQKVQGELYEVTCHVENTGYLVIKDQYLRFHFPASTIMDIFTIKEPPMELGVEKAPLEQPRPTDARWLIGHLEKGQSVTFGFLVAGPTAIAPEIFSHNPEGGVEVSPRSSKAQEHDDFGHVPPLLTIFTISWLLPHIPLLDPDLGGMLTEGLQLALFILALPHLYPVGRLIASRLKPPPDQLSASELAVYDNRAGSLYVATRGGQIRVESGTDEDVPDDAAAI